MGVDAFAEQAQRELLATGETARKRTAQTRDELTAQEATGRPARPRRPLQPRSAPSCSSARAGSNITCARSSPSSTSAPATSYTRRSPTQHRSLPRPSQTSDFVKGPQGRRAAEVAGRRCSRCDDMLPWRSAPRPDRSSRCDPAWGRSRTGASHPFGARGTGAGRSRGLTYLVPPSARSEALAGLARPARRECDVGSSRPSRAAPGGLVRPTDSLRGVKPVSRDSRVNAGLGDLSPSEQPGSVRASQGVREGRGTHLEIRDDGVGDADPRGPGLVGLSDRVTAFDGRLRIENPLEGGTALTATLPLATGSRVPLGSPVVFSPARAGCWRRASGSSGYRRLGWAHRARASASRASQMRSTRSPSPERS
jgi:hypothetical protein